MSIQSPTDVVGEGPLEAVEHEPALLPGLDLAAHLDQVAAAGLLRERQVEAGVGAVAGRLDVRAQVEVVLAHGQVAGQRSRLERRILEMEDFLFE